MNDKLKELIQPYWVEEQQGVYIPLIDKVLLKNNVPEMPYGDYMEYAKSNGVQIATKDELLQMYLQKDEINKILREHNGDMLDTWFGSSSEYGLYYEWFVNFGYGYCYYTSNHYSYVSRAVVDLKSKTICQKKNGAMSDSIKAHKILQPGDRFGHWTVLGYIGLRKASSNARNRLRMYRCRCDCGRERDVRGTDLTKGVSTSCGCRRWEDRREIRDERFNAVTNRVPKP